MSIDGVPAIRRGKREEPLRFNGAVDEHRRSHELAMLSSMVLKSLQWGRR